jgi:hypothetical protein
MSFDQSSLQRLCQELAQQRAPVRPLQALEARVWFAIAEQRETWPRRLEAHLAGWLVPQYRPTSMSMAAMAGLLIALVAQGAPPATTGVNEFRAFAADYGLSLPPMLRSAETDGT